MKEYQEPKVIVVRLDANDIICSSDCGASGTTNTTEWDD